MLLSTLLHAAAVAFLSNRSIRALRDEQHQQLARALPNRATHPLFDTPCERADSGMEIAEFLRFVLGFVQVADGRGGGGPHVVTYETASEQRASTLPSSFDGAWLR